MLSVTITFQSIEDAQVALAKLSSVPVEPRPRFPGAQTDARVGWRGISGF